MSPNFRRQRARKRLFIRKAKHYTKDGVVTAWRAVLFIAMAALLLFCVAWIWCIHAFNAQHVSERITWQLQKTLNRPVRISSLELKFFNVVELKGFSVLDTYGEPGQALVSADSVTLTFDLLPLLEQRLVIHEVTLNAPRFNLVRAEDGSYNIPHITTNSKQPSTYTSATGRKFLVTIEDWSIKEGVLSFKDLPSGASHALYGINAHFENLRFDELSPFSVNMILRNQWQDKVSEIEINTTGEINFAGFNRQAFALRKLKTQVFLFQNPLNLELDVDSITQPSFKGTAFVPSFSAKDVSLFGIDRFSFSVPATTLSFQGKLTDNYKKLTLSELSAQAADMELNATGDADFSQNPFTLGVEFSTNSFTLADKNILWPVLGKYKLTGKASVKGKLVRTNGKMDLPLLLIQADKVSGDFYGFKASDVTGEFQAKNQFSDLYARTKTGKVEVAQSTFDKLQFSGSWRKGNLYAFIASSELNQTPFKMNLTIDRLKKEDRQIRTHLHFKQFDPMAFIATVQDFVTVITPLTAETESTPEVTGDLAWLRNFRDRLPEFMPNFAGTISAEEFSSAVLSGNHFDAEFNLTGLQAGAKKLSGPIELKLQEGIIHQMEKLAAEQEALNVTFQPFIMMHRMERAGSFSVGKVLRDVEVNELAASVLFNNGTMQINNAYTVGPTISAAVSGSVDWVGETFDLTVSTMFTNTSKSGVLAENLTDESGNPALAFRISQSMTKPKLEMLRAKKAGKTIRAAQEKGVNTDFSQAENFTQGDFHATK